MSLPSSQARLVCMARLLGALLLAVGCDHRIPLGHGLAPETDNTAGAATDGAGGSPTDGFGGGSTGGFGAGAGGGAAGMGGTAEAGAGGDFDAGGAPGTGGSDAGGGDTEAGTELCPVDYHTAEGTPCSVEGTHCGACTDECRFCTRLVCDSGKWGLMELFPNPACWKDAGSDVADECPTDVKEAKGKPCPVGKTCGTCEDKCHFCAMLQCPEGTWLLMEVAPDPACHKDSGPDDAESDAD